MTENECARFYMKLIEAGREVEKMKNNFLTIFGVDIEAFDNIHDKLADAAFQAIISTKFGGNPPNERVEHDFIQSRLDQHMKINIGAGRSEVFIANHYVLFIAVGYSRPSVNLRE